MISAIRKWWSNRAKYNEETFQRMCRLHEATIMQETMKQFRDMRLQLAEKENIINELKASKDLKNKSKGIQRHK